MNEHAAKLAEMADEQDSGVPENVPLIQALAAKSIAFSLLGIAESLQRIADSLETTSGASTFR